MLNGNGLAAARVGDLIAAARDALRVIRAGQRTGHFRSEIQLVRNRDMIVDQLLVILGAGALNVVLLHTPIAAHSRPRLKISRAIRKVASSRSGFLAMTDREPPGQVGFDVEDYPNKEVHPNAPSFIHALGRIVFYWGQFDAIVSLVQDIMIRLAYEAGEQEEAQVSFSRRIRQRVSIPSFLI